MKSLTALLISLLLGCSMAKLPNSKLPPYQLATSYAFVNDTLHVQLTNTLMCPMRIWVQPKDSILNTYFKQINPILVEPMGDTVIHLKAQSPLSKKLQFASRYGDIEENITATKVELPFKKDKSYRLIQGYESSPTHNTDWSRYALDFGLQIGDTVCSATSGYVVGVIEDYKYGGARQEWIDYANSITVYDPKTGLYTQYVHLDYKGSLVHIGDHIEAGQKIGISGMTGYTNIEHLHFNCLKPIHSSDGLKSIPVDSIGDYPLSDLSRNQLIHN